MPDRPYTLLSCGMSIDGYLGSAAPRRPSRCEAVGTERIRSSASTSVSGRRTSKDRGPCTATSADRRATGIRSAAERCELQDDDRIAALGVPLYLAVAAVHFASPSGRLRRMCSRRSGAMRSSSSSVGTIL